MRIGIDCRLWNETGVGRYIRNLIYNLQILDNKNEYVLFVGNNDYKEFKIDNPGWKIVYTNIHWHSLEEQIKFPQILFLENLDLMHFPYFSIPVFYNRPFVVTIHDLIIYHFSTGKASTLPLPFYHLKRFGYQRILAHAVTHAEKIIVPLHSVEQDLNQTLHVPIEKIVVTPEGVDQEVLSIKHKVSSIEKVGHAKYIKSDTKYFLYVGNAYPHKNLERLVEAFSRISTNKDRMIANKKDLGIKLILVGKEDYFYKRLKEKVKLMNLHDKVVFDGHVSDGELSYLYFHTLAYISPSLMEGFGLPPLEALSHNCPVLVSDIPAFREVLSDAVIYFNPE